MRKFLGAAALVALAVAGCGGDDESGDGDLAAYCELVEESESSSDGFPTDEEIEAFLDVAPEQIRGEIETLTDAFADLEDPEDVEALFEALEEPEVADAIEEIEAFDAENCDGSDEASASASTPEDENEDEDEETTTTASEDDDPAGGDDDAAEAAEGSLCEEITDAEVSELVGVELSSADTLFNDEDNCYYEGADGEELFIGRIETPGLSPDLFLDTGEANSDDFEELDGIADAAYFATTEFSGALAGALDGDVVLNIAYDDGGDDHTAHRDAVVELLELLAET